MSSGDKAAPSDQGRASDMPQYSALELLAVLFSRDAVCSSGGEEEEGEGDEDEAGRSSVAAAARGQPRSTDVREPPEAEGRRAAEKDGRQEKGQGRRINEEVSEEEDHEECDSDRGLTSSDTGEGDERGGVEEEEQDRRRNEGESSGGAEQGREARWEDGGAVVSLSPTAPTLAPTRAAGGRRAGAVRPEPESSPGGPEREELEEEEEEETLSEEEENDEGGEERRLGSRRRRRAQNFYYSKCGQITWCGAPYGRPCTSRASPPSDSDSDSRPDDSSSPWRGRPPSPPPVGRPGPTDEAAEGATGLASTFGLFVTPAIERILVEETNREGSRRFGPDAWKDMDVTDLRAYLGLLILAGVFRSRGEAAESLWDAEVGRAIFRATMPLKRFYAYSSLLRFDDRSTRAERRAGGDRLAAVREVWDLWAARLPRLYNPGPDVTVDEQLVRFRGRCPFRVYMPNKPARYGIKTWVVCDARSSYAWKMQVYTGKSADGGGGGGGASLPERVVMELTEGLGGERTVTCDNFFTSYSLARNLLLKRDLSLVGTVRKNKPFLPPQFAAGGPWQEGGGQEEAVEGGGREGRSERRAAVGRRPRREPGSVEYAFSTLPAVLVSYRARRNRSVLLLSTKRRHMFVPGPRGGPVNAAAPPKPPVVLYYNKNKGGVDNLDKVVAAYSCRRKTARWPLAIFHNILDVSSYNAFVLWRELHPEWMRGRLNKRRIFLAQLGKELVAPLIGRRRRMPRTEAAQAVVRGVRDQAAATATAAVAARRRRQRARRLPETTSSSSSSSGEKEGEEEEGSAAAAGPPLPTRTAAAGRGRAGERRRRAPLDTTSSSSLSSSPRRSSEEREEESDGSAPPRTPGGKRKRCQVCPSKKDRKTQTLCSGCGRYICGACTVPLCRACATKLLGRTRFEGGGPRGRRARGGDGRQEQERDYSDQ